MHYNTAYTKFNLIEEIKVIKVIKDKYVKKQLILALIDNKYNKPWKNNYTYSDDGKHTLIALLIDYNKGTYYMGKNIATDFTVEELENICNSLDL